MRHDVGIRPQLLNPITELEALTLIESDTWCVQEKMDGKHVMIYKLGNEIVAANKQGLQCWVSDDIITSVKNTFSGDVLLDGELIGDTFFLFDILEYSEGCVRQWSYADRYRHLIAPLLLPKPMSIVPAYFGTCDKLDFYELCKAKGKEGIVLKKLDMPWSEGRPEFGGNMLKCKFWYTLSAIVSDVSTGKSSFMSFVLDENGRQYNLGSCTVCGKPIPRPGSVAEIKYLYCVERLVQPSYLGVRSDVLPTECVKSQIKFKSL